MNRFNWLVVAALVCVSSPAYGEEPQNLQLQTAKELCGKSAAKTEAHCTGCPAVFGKKAEGNLKVEEVIEIQSTDGKVVRAVRTSGCSSTSATVVLTKSKAGWTPIGEPIEKECSSASGVLECRDASGPTQAQIDVKAGTVTLRPRGTGRGGGGISERGIGLANVGTSRSRTNRVPQVTAGEVKVKGPLDKEVIRRAVRQRHGEIKYCYASELTKNAELAGSVDVRFVISASGSVVSAKIPDSTLDNAAVKNCIAGKARRWRFPKPKGGGIVTVDFPFVLTSKIQPQKQGYGEGDREERRAIVPKIVPGKPIVEGGLDKEIVRRVVRQHRRELKYCYEVGLEKNVELKGRVVIQFTIGETGKVLSADVKESNMKDSAVEQCINGKVGRWVFPKPKGGKPVRVTYPFNFSI